MSACTWCDGTGWLDGYGAFPGGDPRNFHPDPECSTEDERKAHADACAAHRTELEAAHVMEHHADGGYSHTSRIMFGLGSYRVPCFECRTGAT